MRACHACPNTEAYTTINNTICCLSASRLSAATNLVERYKNVEDEEIPE